MLGNIVLQHKPAFFDDEKRREIIVRERRNILFSIPLNFKNQDSTKTRFSSRENDFTS